MSRKPSKKEMLASLSRAAEENASSIKAAMSIVRDMSSSRESSPEYNPRSDSRIRYPDDLPPAPSRSRVQGVQVQSKLPAYEEGEEGEEGEEVGAKRAPVSRAITAAPKKAARSASRSQQVIQDTQVFQLPRRGKPAAQNMDTVFGKPVYESRGVSPSVGTSIGWRNNYVIQHEKEPAAGGGQATAPIELAKNKQAEKLVKKSQTESMNKEKMHEAFEKRLELMNERGILYFADAANDNVSRPVLYRGAQVSFPRASGSINLLYPRSAIMNILILAKKLRLFNEDWMAKEWLDNNLDKIWENIIFCSEFTNYGLPDLHTYVIGKNIEKHARGRDLDFLPLSDTGLNDLTTNMQRLKSLLAELNDKLANVAKTPENVKISVFDNAKIKEFSRNADKFVNTVLAEIGSKSAPAGRIEEQVYGYATTVIATITISAVVTVIPLLYALESSDFVRNAIINALRSKTFLRILGTSFAIGCSHEIAIFIEQVVETAGKMFDLMPNQIDIIRDNITEAVNSLSGNKVVVSSDKNKSRKMIHAFDVLSQDWALDFQRQERAGLESAEANWLTQSKKSAKEQLAESQDERMKMLDALYNDSDDEYSQLSAVGSRQPSPESDSSDMFDEYDYDEDQEEEEDEMDIRKGGKRTTKRSKKTKKRKQKKTKTVKRKRRTAKK